MVTWLPAKVPALNSHMEAQSFLTFRRTSVSSAVTIGANSFVNLCTTGCTSPLRSNPFRV
eukprot:CAMPEP_0204438796 /NCGR_PEP_ID=MMETSP0470-20130426/80109_1 /ASSEMBLY_ACC=CAM_ASM_000385 /TAXON_ID=2969 /ORGANISM="Oxyrrhis marina" /LENGTH=59 /DNA_ID=CAMNT_0051437655 /DNA_START=116 /DNA_END=295 /DNA_ORIENTATION=+